MKFIHPIDDFLDYLPVILYLLVKYPKPIDLYLSLLIIVLQVHAF